MILESLNIGGGEAIVAQAVVGEVRQIIGQQMRGLAAEDAAAFGRQTDEQPSLHAIRGDKHVSALEDLLTDVTDMYVTRAVGIGLDTPSQEVGYRYPASGIVNEVLWDARGLHGKDEPHFRRARIRIGLHAVDGNR